MPSRSEVIEFWDSVVARFLDGETTDYPEPLDRWFLAYAGRGDGEVVVEALPEPYIGDLASGKTRAVTLALNPGEAWRRVYGRKRDED